MAKGIVYILTSPAFDHWVKIGISDRNNIDEILAESNRLADIPLGFRAYAVYEVERPQEVEKSIHILFDSYECLDGISIWSNNRVRVGEFFHIPPEAAFEVLKSIAQLRGDENCLKLIAPMDEYEGNDIDDYEGYEIRIHPSLQPLRVRFVEFDNEYRIPTLASGAQKIFVERLAQKLPVTFKDLYPMIEQENPFKATRLPPFKFSMLQIPVETELKFLHDDECVCYTKDMNNKVEYEGSEYSLSGLAQKLLAEKCGWEKVNISASAPGFFTYQGKTLTELRKIQERGGTDEVEKTIS